MRKPKRNSTKIVSSMAYSISGTIYYREVTEKNRVHYEYYHLDGTEVVPEDYKEIFFVCLREDGCLELPATVESTCRTARKEVQFCKALGAGSGKELTINQN